MTDFIKDLKKDILKSTPDVSEDWAEFCSIIPLSTILPNTRIIERVSPLKLNLLMITVGQSGITKSIPLMSYTRRIVYDTGRRIGLDLILPSRSSVEGMIKYLGDGKDNDLPRHVGVIIRDEFSGLFKQLRKADWQSDGMEFISEMYDGTFQKRVTTSHGLHTVDDLYANLITATTPYFLSHLDANFFIQGTGNRFLYSFHSIEDYQIENVNYEEYFSRDWGNKRDSEIEKHVSRLVGIYNKGIRDLYVVGDGGQLWAEYKKQCDTEWKNKSVDDQAGWEHHPIRRYPELALKLSGIYCISSFIDTIPRMSIEDFIITPKHMQRAINLVERNRENFKRIIEAKRKHVPRRQPISIEDEAKNMLLVLASAEDKILMSGEWLNRYDGTSNKGKKDELRNYCLSKGWVKVLSYREVEPEIRKKIGMTIQGRVYKYIKGLSSV